MEGQTFLKKDNCGVLSSLVTAGRTKCEYLPAGSCGSHGLSEIWSCWERLQAGSSLPSPFEIRYAAGLFLQVLGKGRVAGNCAAQGIDGSGFFGPQW